MLVRGSPRGIIYAAGKRIQRCLLISEDCCAIGEWSLFILSTWVGSCWHSNKVHLMLILQWLILRLKITYSQNLHLSCCHRQRHNMESLTFCYNCFKPEPQHLIPFQISPPEVFGFFLTDTNFNFQEFKCRCYQRVLYFSFDHSTASNSWSCWTFKQGWIHFLLYLTSNFSKWNGSFRCIDEGNFVCLYVIPFHKGFEVSL